jgi:hypothetical protein
MRREWWGDTTQEGAGETCVIRSFVLKSKSSIRRQARHPTFLTEELTKRGWLKHLDVDNKVIIKRNLEM